jgi:diacylglycerol kinase family enzyme
MAGGVAVLINRHAHRATATRIDWLRQAAGGDNVFLTDSPAEAQAAAAAIVERGYEKLCVAGGDGTFMQVAADLAALSPARMPALFPLRMGTGNAISDVSGASAPTREGLTRDVVRARNAAGDGIRPIHLLEVDGRVTHFAGVGLDADWADDYKRIVRQRLYKTPAAPIFRGVLGYLVTAAGATVPRLLVRPRRPVRITAIGPVVPLDLDGRPAGDPLPDGALVHEGPVTMAAASTVESYSRGFRFFPFADRLDGAFQLRVLSAGLGHILVNLRKAWSGRYRNPAKVHDWAATGIRVELPSPACFHVGGDVQPATTSFTVTLSSRSVPVVRAPA